MEQSENVNAKIAFFVASMRGGGAERVIVKLANYCAQKGHPVDLILVKKEGPYLQELSHQVNVIDFNSSRTIYTLLSLVKYLKVVKPAILFSTMAHVNVIALLARWLSAVQTRVVIKEVTVVSKNSTKPKGKLLLFMVKRFYPCAELIMAVSNGVAEDLKKITRKEMENMLVIYDPVVDDQLHQLTLEEPDHPWLLDNKAPVILAVGRLSMEKDYPTLIRAFEIVKKNTPARLIILGEGSERERLEHLVTEMNLVDAVSMPGFKDNPFAYMRKAAVFVLSSRWEGLSNVLIQAMAVGTPVVATDCPCGPAEVLMGGKYGLFVPVGDYEALAAAILETMKSPLVTKRLLQDRAGDFKAEFILNQHYEQMWRGLSVEKN